METLKLKSNIKCGACVEKVTAPLNETVGAGNWEVDLADPRRILTIEADNITAFQINETLKKVGYSVEEL